MFKTCVAVFSQEEPKFMQVLSSVPTHMRYDFLGPNMMVDRLAACIHLMLLKGPDYAFESTEWLSMFRIKSHKSFDFEDDTFTKEGVMVDLQWELKSVLVSAWNFVLRLCDLVDTMSDHMKSL